MNVNIVHRMNDKLKRHQKPIKLFNLSLLLPNFPVTLVSLPLTCRGPAKTLEQTVGPDWATIVHVELLFLGIPDAKSLIIEQ